MNKFDFFEKLKKKIVTGAGRRRGPMCVWKNVDKYHMGERVGLKSTKKVARII